MATLQHQAGPPARDLSNVSGLDGVARILQVQPKHLGLVLYRRGPESYYSRFTISKKSGGLREIASPHFPLNMLQARLAGVLDGLYVPRVSAHGYVKGRSILTNALPHTGKQHVLNVDLQNFFPSLNFGRVRGVLMAPPFNCPDRAASVLAKLACLDNGLPIGAPSSPVLSNMICMRLDGQLQRFAQQHRCWYTRYADDLTFSTRSSWFPKQLASSEAGVTYLGDELKSIIESNGFVVNPRKTRLAGPGSRHSVTGITVNVNTNVRRKYVRQVRAMLHSWSRDGLAAHRK